MTVLSKVNKSINIKTGHNKFNKIFNSKKVAPYVFVSPFLLTFLLIYVYPFIKGLSMSFQEVLPGQTSFIGFDNYSRLLNTTFYTAIKNSTIYTVLTVVILVTIPIILAILLDSKAVKFKTFFRASLFIPALTSTIVAGVIFRLMFGESDSAAANQILNLFGLNSVDWRYNAWSGMLLMVMLTSWRWMGVNTVYFLAGLQNIPKVLYEAAEIDGANYLQRLRFITLPSLKPIITFVTTISIIGGFRMFEESFAFWESGSPGDIGLTIVGYIYQEGIRQNDMGYGAAVGIVLLIIIFFVSLTQLLLTGTFKNEERIK